MPRSQQLVPFPIESLVRVRDGWVTLSAAVVGGPLHEAARLDVASAYSLGRELIDCAEGLLAGVPRPWDGDPGRVPFASRGRGGQRASAAPRSAADGRAGAPIRPGRGVESRA